MRRLHGQHQERAYDLVVVGGGMAGIAAAVTAARHGSHVALVHERPVLGGNASAEIRVNLEGANGGSHNRFFVESGLAEDLLLLNLRRNPTGSVDHWSALLYDLVHSEPRLDLYLDTVVDEVDTDDDKTPTVIRSVGALTLAAERRWTFGARIFVDATGDGSLAAAAGAGYMIGEDGRDAFGEALAPPAPTPLRLGATMQFMCKDVGRQVDFVAPSFARRVRPEDLRANRYIDVWAQDPVLGGFWWIEYGGNLDSIADNPDVKRVLLAEVYGVWDYVKNHPSLAERNRTLDLEWVAAVPGKRESRRIAGHYVLTEHDLAPGDRFHDAVAFGGWSMDRHPPGGFTATDVVPATQVHPPSVYQIPLRALIARDVANLFLGGRNISASHIALCSTRVMLTCAHIGEAVGVAAHACCAAGSMPADLPADRPMMAGIRAALERIGHHIPFVPLTADRPPAGTTASATSVAPLADDVVDEVVALDKPRMLSLPPLLQALDELELWVVTEAPCRMRYRAFESRGDGSWRTGSPMREGSVLLPPLPDGGWVAIPLDLPPQPAYVHVALQGAGVRLGANSRRILGPVSWVSVQSDIDAPVVDDRQARGWDVANQKEAFGDASGYVFSAWKREGRGWGRPPGPALAFRAQPDALLVAADAVLEPFERPTTSGVHAWTTSALPGTCRSEEYVFDEPPRLVLTFPGDCHLNEATFLLNSDLEHHLANIWYSHAPGRTAQPTLLRAFTVELLDSAGNVAWSGHVSDNWRRRVTVPVHATGRRLVITVTSTNGADTASIMDIRLPGCRLVAGKP